MSEKNNFKITMTERRDGTIRIEAIGFRERYGSEFVCFVPQEQLTIDGQAVKEGDEGCLAKSYNTIGDEDSVFWLSSNPEGIPGNLSPAQYRLHGWRGTTNDRSVFAHGWRKVLSVAPRKRGIGWVATLSADLRQDAD